MEIEKPITAGVSELPDVFAAEAARRGFTAPETGSLAMAGATQTESKGDVDDGSSRSEVFSPSKEDLEYSAFGRGCD